MTEILNNYGRGRILIAVDGPEAGATGAFADALAAALRERDRTVFRAAAQTTGVSDAEAGRVRDVLTRFRGGAAADGSDVPDDALLVVDGRFLLQLRLRGSWHFRIWLEGGPELSPDAYAERARYVRDDAPRGAADAIYDVTDADAPRRVWSDSC